MTHEFLIILGLEEKRRTSWTWSTKICASWRMLRAKIRGENHRMLGTCHTMRGEWPMKSSSKCEMDLGMGPLD